MYLNDTIIADWILSTPNRLGSEWAPPSRSWNGQGKTDEGQQKRWRNGVVAASKMSTLSPKRKATCSGAILILVRAQPGKLNRNGVRTEAEFGPDLPDEDKTFPRPRPSLSA